MLGERHAYKTPICSRQWLLHLLGSFSELFAFFVFFFLLDRPRCDSGVRVQLKSLEMQQHSGSECSLI